jgi:dTDP-4-dehydrorhamnose 3,5-epimerase-like enzyme
MSIAAHSYFRRFPDNSGDFTRLPNMEIIRTPIDDMIILRPTPIWDERGYFSRTLDIQTLAELAPCST